MKKIGFLGGGITRSRALASLVLFTASFAFAAETKPVVDLTPVPLPREFTSDMDRPVAFGPATRVAVACPDGTSVAWLDRRLASWYGAFAPRATAVASADLPLHEHPEAYAVSVGPSGVRIAARTAAGVRYAAYALRQLAIAKRGTRKTSGYLLPTCEIRDWPQLSFRAIHVCWFAEVRPKQLERAIWLAAYMRFNHVIVDVWGGQYRSERHPWCGWPEGTATKAEIAKLVAAAREAGVTLIPQINVLGHAAMARSRGLKHAVLDLHPEYAPLFEPGGWNWCLSNPETKRVLKDLVAEMYDDFGRPGYFHLGCDEGQPPSCPDCRKDYGRLVCDHVNAMARHVSSLGARPMIWHDMLLERGNPRWKGFVASGSSETIRLADDLAKDVIVCDWEYSEGNESERRTDWPTIAYLKGKGFAVAGSPWQNYNSMRLMADYLAKSGCFGYVQTTWHHMRGADWRDIFVAGSSAAWGVPQPPEIPQFETPFANVLRYAGYDAHVTDPLDTGLYNYQNPPAWWLDN